MHQTFSFRRYLIALILTATLFITAFLILNILTSKKLENIKNIEDSISVTILSSELEYELLKEVSCELPNSKYRTTLNDEIEQLANMLEILENNDTNDERITVAKKRYSLLLIKDYLLSKRISESCKTKPTFIIYFYGNADTCPECLKTSFALTSLRDQYDNLRVYAFDMDLDLPLIKSFAKIYKISNQTLPALIIDKKVYIGLTTKDEIEKLLPKEVKILNATSTRRAFFQVKFINS